MHVVGIAPLTSMFLFDETNRGRLDDYRPEVHDSDGLHDRPRTPASRSSGSSPTPPSCRSRPSRPSRRRASGWCSARASRAISRTSRISTSGGRAPGSSRRAIGARARSNSWRSRRDAKATTTSWPSGGPRTASPPATRRISPTASPGWRSPPLPKGLGEDRGDPLRRKPRRQAARVHPGLRRRRREDRRLAPRSSAPPRGKLSNVALMSNGALHGLRASFEVDPNDADLIELRLRVMRGDKPGHRDLAVSMDRTLSSAARLPAPRSRPGGMPPESRARRCRPQDLRLRAARAPARRATAAVLFARFILITVTSGVTDLRHLPDAAGGALRQHDAAAGPDDFLLRGVARLDRLCGGIGDRRRIEAPRSESVAGARPERVADGAGHADLQRGPAAHHGRAAGDGRGARAASARTAASRSSCCRTRPMPTLDPRDLGDRRLAQVARRPSCPSGTGGAGRTSRASPATSRTSSRAGAAATIT